MQFLIEHVKKNYGKKEVLRDVNFSFEAGKIYGLLGRNGSGKTTLFNCINGDINVDGGSFAIIEDEKRRSMDVSELGYVLSTPEVPEFLTGREFVRFFMEVNQVEGAGYQQIDSYFDVMKIQPEDRDRLMKDYSHGMKNKLQMLVNLLANPKVLLLDEPLTSLDVVVAEEMKSLLREQKGGKVIIFSTHILDLAADLCDEIVLLNHGTLEKIDKENLEGAEFKEKIIAALQEAE